MYIIFLGAPGAGKGTQADYVARELNLNHLAAGDLLRKEVERGTELGKKAQAYMEKGALAPDTVVIPMVLKAMTSFKEGAGVILDGFPRSRVQAEELDKAMAEGGMTIDKVVCIDVSEEELVRRLSGRRICRSCQWPYHVYSSPPEVEDKCDRCEGELYQRADDNVTAVKHRLEVYAGETTPLIQHYADMGKLVRVDGEGAFEEVGRRIITALKE